MESLCSRYKEMIFDFIDGELTDAQSDEFKKHINECESCRAEYLLRRKTIKLIADSAYMPERSLAAAVIGNITRIKKNKLRFLRGSTIAACIVAVIIISNFAFMDMLQKNKTGMTDSAASLKSDEIAESFYSEEAPAPVLGILEKNVNPDDEGDMPRKAGIVPEKEQQAETAAELSAVTTSCEITAQDADSAADMIKYYTELYAPDYKGQVGMVIISDEAPVTDTTDIAGTEIFKDADDYSLYIINYSPETAQLLSESAEKSGADQYLQPADNTQYILYVYLKK